MFSFTRRLETVNNVTKHRITSRIVSYSFHISNFWVFPDLQGGFKDGRRRGRKGQKGKGGKEKGRIGEVREKKRGKGREWEKDGGEWKE